MLNDPIFVEASRAFGIRMAKAPGTPVEKIRWGLQEAFSRSGTPEEVDILLRVYRAQREKFDADEVAAKEFLTIGESPVPTDLPAAEAAAWGQVGRALLNAYETTSRF